MGLKVGELARRSGLTIRTLHHYDSIGLLCPSARSEAGYRLYSDADVARLHGIQALRQWGLGLSEIGALLANQGATLPAILITADRSPGVREEARVHGVQMLNKPIRPAALRALLAQCRVQRVAAAE